MANLTIQMRLITTEAEIKNEILTRCAAEVNRRLMTNVLKNDIRKLTQAILESYIMSQPEYDSIKGGTLREELGIADPNDIDQIIKIWVRGVNVVMAPATIAGNKIIGDIILTAIPADYSDVLASSYASYRTQKGDDIPWLSWLLLQGDNIIIANHKVFYDPDKTQFSRTDTDIMIPTTGEGWRVPPEFAGTIDNNFVTRAVMSALPELYHALENAIRSKL